ncbi:hypothetical protein Ddc_08259 [Ditylenchus destructor]|nr:hypothetical protein Ddc_08259 [Ditylenchus destructor]
MSEWLSPTPYGIIPASELCRSSYLVTSDDGSVTKAEKRYPSPPRELPINYAYYMGHRGRPNSIIDNYHSHYYGIAPGDQDNVHRELPPRPGPSHSFHQKRSRTAPTGRATEDQLYVPRQRLSRVVPARVESTEYRSYSGPTKRPAPLYKKRRDSRHFSQQETSFTRYKQPSIGPYYESTGVAGLSSTQYFRPPPHVDTLTRSGQPRPYYMPSYSTYPPTAMYPPTPVQYLAGAASAVARKAGGFGAIPNRPDSQYIQERFPILARIAMKFAQLALGAAIVGLVYGPMRGNSYSNFVTQTNTEWQGLVLGIAIAFAFCALILLLTVFMANTSHCWRQIDALVSGFASLLYILATSLEAYYAACYPPNGARINLVCYRPEWIIATCLCFANLIVYATDLIMAARTGVNLL